MKTSIDWREKDAAGHSVVTISQPGPGLAHLFGVPFLYFGGYLLYQFAGGVVHPGELTIFGWTLLPLFALTFFIPGWLIVFFRKRASINPSAREIVEEYDFLLYTYRARTTIGTDAHVMQRYERGSPSTLRGGVMSSSKTLYWIHVYLVTGTHQILLALFRDGEKPAAAAFAQRVGTYVKVNVQDTLVERGDVTSGGVVVANVDEE